MTGNALIRSTSFAGLSASTGGTLTNSLGFSVNSTAAAGSLAGTVSLNLVSNHNGVAGLTDGAATIASSGAITTTGQIYSGLMAWNGGSGNWNVNGNWTDTLSAAVHAPPGLDAAYQTTDAAAFAAGPGGTVSLNGVSPSLAALSFSASGARTSPWRKAARARWRSTAAARRPPSPWPATRRSPPRSNWRPPPA